MRSRLCWWWSRRLTGVRAVSVGVALSAAASVSACGAPAPPDASQARALTPSQELVARRFANALVIRSRGLTTSAGARVTTGRYRELTRCLSDWEAAPEGLGDLDRIYDVARGSRLALRRDAGYRRTLAELSGVARLSGVPILADAVAVLDQQRAAVRTLARLTLDTCALLRQWKTWHWSTTPAPPRVRRVLELADPDATSRGRRRADILRRAAQLLEEHGGRRGTAAAG